jgi:hypothetical protein
MSPEQIREHIRYHMREIERLQQEAAMNQEIVERLNVLLWESERYAMTGKLTISADDSLN